jgi:hypothetical protein
LTAFAQRSVKKYEGTLPADSKLRKGVHNARVALWAVSTASPPTELLAEVNALRTRGNFKEIRLIMHDKYNHPGGGENAFKARVFEGAKALARVIDALMDTLDELKNAGAEELNEAPSRWQANYVYVSARLQAQLVYLEEYQSLLGQMRKELPPIEQGKGETGWRMAAKDKPSDSAKKIMKEVRKGYAELAKKHKGTPWEVLGKRGELTALGLEWQAD